jgi:hypothetical protein
MHQQKQWSRVLLGELWVPHQPTIYPQQNAGRSDDLQWTLRTRYSGC